MGLFRSFASFSFAIVESKCKGVVVSVFGVLAVQPPIQYEYSLICSNTGKQANTDPETVPCGSSGTCTRHRRAGAGYVRLTGKRVSAKRIGVRVVVRGGMEISRCGVVDDEYGYDDRYCTMIVVMIMMETIRDIVVMTMVMMVMMERVIRVWSLHDFWSP